MLVQIKRNYDKPDLLRQTPGYSGEWEDMKFTYDDVEECDYLVVLNHPLEDLTGWCRTGGRILIIQEPPYEKNNYFRGYVPYFDKVIAGFPAQDDTRILNVQAALPWQINKTYDELKLLSRLGIGSKLDKVSWVTSNSNMNPGHKPRLDFLQFLQSSDIGLALFGRGFQPIPDKFDGVFPYKYSIAVENYSDYNYFTEKIFDVFLSWSMPVYYGCKNIEDYFPAESMIRIDINRPEESLEIIRKAISDKLWEKNIDAIAHARELVLDKYQFFPFISKIIKTGHAADPAKKIKYFIPRFPGESSSLLARILRKIKK